MRSWVSSIDWLDDSAGELSLEDTPGIPDIDVDIVEPGLEPVSPDLEDQLDLTDSRYVQPDDTDAGHTPDTSDNNLNGHEPGQDDRGAEGREKKSDAPADTNKAKTAADTRPAPEVEPKPAIFYVEDGNGITHEIVDYAQNVKGEELSGEQAFRIYEKLEKEFGNKIINIKNTANDVYVMDDGNYGISRPGEAQWFADAQARLNQLIEEEKLEKAA